MFRYTLLLSLCFIGTAWQPAVAFTPKSPLVQQFQTDLEHLAKKNNPNFSGFSAEEGKSFYFREHVHSKDGDKRSCATCHTKDPMNSSKHAVTGKKIDPLSPKVNRKRFTKVKKIEKWFRRNCKWTLERECTPKEKGDFLEFIYSL